MYQGSKSRLAKDIVPIINSFSKGKVFIDACCGGCNIIANPKYKIEAKEKIAYDNNRYLIALLNKFKTDKPNFTDVTEEEYKAVKNNKQNYEDWYVGYVGFLASFGAGFFNGFARSKERNRTLGAYNGLSKQDFSDIEIKQQDLFNLQTTNAVIYIDPPYINTKKYKTKFDYQKFWNKAKELSQYNIVLVSEQTIPDNVEILLEKELKMTMNAKGSYKTRTEYLVKYKSR
jgi:putative site-specific DNA-methyltransferase (fragment)